VLSQLVGPESVGYHVAKAGLEQLTRFLAVKLGSENIRVNAVRLGVAAKEPLFGEPESTALREFKLRHAIYHPLKSLVTPADLAAAILFLVSSGSARITGQILSLDGGLTIQEPMELCKRLSDGTRDV
jgi:3-oxoacyl-[acyl-carrier protein] reductase